MGELGVRDGLGSINLDRLLNVDGISKVGERESGLAKGILVGFWAWLCFEWWVVFEK